MEIKDTWHMTQDELVRLVDHIYSGIIRSNWMPDYIVGIARGGLVPAVMLSHRLGVNCYALSVQLRDGVNDAESNLWMPEDAVDGKKILIVDDIKDTGKTLRWIKDDWQSTVGYADFAGFWNTNVRFATVINDLDDANDLVVDYCGLYREGADKKQWIEFPYEKWWSEDK